VGARINSSQKNINFTPMRNYIFLSFVVILLFSNCNSTNQQKADASSLVIPLTHESFKKEVFDYNTDMKWKFEGDLPVIIDFYADWCGPCKELSPRLEEIAKEYEGKIIVYKVNTDAEKLLSQDLGITNLPTLVFIPIKGNPRSAVGSLTKADLVKAVKEVLLVN
jgi:thioredoxin 1